MAGLKKPGNGKKRSKASIERSKRARAKLKGQGNHWSSDGISFLTQIVRNNDNTQVPTAPIGISRTGHPMKPRKQKQSKYSPNVNQA